MALPWDTYPHYFARLAAYAANLEAETAGQMASSRLAGQVQGAVATPEEILAVMRFGDLAHAATVEDQIKVRITVSEPTTWSRVLQALEGTFRMLEDGERPALGGASAAGYAVAVLPEHLAPAGWPVENRDFPSAFTIEISVRP